MTQCQVCASGPLVYSNEQVQEILVLIAEKSSYEQGVVARSLA